MYRIDFTFNFRGQDVFCLQKNEPVIRDGFLLINKAPFYYEKPKHGASGYVRSVMPEFQLYKVNRDCVRFISRVDVDDYDSETCVLSNRQASLRTYG